MSNNRIEVERFTLSCGLTVPVTLYFNDDNFTIGDWLLNDEDSELNIEQITELKLLLTKYELL